MGHPQASRAAAIGKRPGNNKFRTSDSAICGGRLTWVAAALLATLMSGSASQAQTGPFAGLAGNWSGSGTITLDDGSTERVRCRASYAVGAGGNGLNQTLVCASDSYKFDLRSNVMAERGRLDGHLE